MAVLVKIDKSAFTTRDLQINQFMSEYDNILTRFVDKREPLKELVWEQLLGKESLELISNEETSKEYAAYESEFYKKVDKDKLWNSLYVTREEVRELLSKRFAAKKLIQLKIPVDLIEVSPKEVESYYLQNRNQLGLRPIDEVKPMILKTLQEKKAQSRMKDWVTAVSRSHSIVYMSGFRIQ